MLNWKKLFIISVLLTYFYLFMEWLFFATIPAFMEGMAFHEKLGILFISAALTALLVLAPLSLLFVLFLIFAPLRIAKLFFGTGALFISFILSALLLILVDNFTYTVFHFGIVTSSGIWRGVYAAFFLLLLGITTRWIHRILNQKPEAHLTTKIVFFSLIGISLIFGIWQYEPVTYQNSQSHSLSKTPNILLIGSDGVSASHMSLYGYERETTPFIEKLASDSLVAENAFPNFSLSNWSIISILTGRSPAELQMTNYQILRGNDAYQHLPGILRSYGYYTAQFGVVQYVDADKINLQGAFDEVNGHSSLLKPCTIVGRVLGTADACYFISLVWDRLSTRILHIFYIKEMPNPYKMVTQPGQFSDLEKINQALALLKNSEMPVFVHVHLLGTHGPRFSPPHQVFSTGEEQNEDWMMDYYDDAILNFDAYIEEVYNDLLASGELDNTIIVIYTDHGMAWNAKTRIPLLIYLPDKKIGRKIKTNVQNMDIAPTLLEYLGIPKPSWMMGISFLHSDPPASRLVVNMNRATLISMIQYDNWYDFHINKKVWTTGKIDVPLQIYSESEASHMEIPREIQEYLVHRGIAWQEMAFSMVALNITGEKTIRRSLLAMALLQSKNGYSYFPPEATGIFSDVSISDFYAPWIEQTYLTGMMEPCAKSPLLLFCPQQPVNRAEISMILLKAIEGKNYSPPPAKGIFDDVPVDSPFAPWIEEIYRRGITSGCSQRPRKFCPEVNLTGSQLATFLNSAFSQ